MCTIESNDIRIPTVPAIRKLLDPIEERLVNIEISIVKTTSQNSLINENKNLKNLNTIIIFSAVLVLGIGFISYHNRVSDDKHVN